MFRCRTDIPVRQRLTHVRRNDVPKTIPPSSKAPFVLPSNFEVRGQVFKFQFWCHDQLLILFLKQRIDPPGNLFECPKLKFEDLTPCS
ncbi:MAG: hypothetical protein JWM11_1349 [Planctomycetaceae bacterium]|nr:hypothetical protein [Planctomycetaceae bacterium]